MLIIALGLLAGWILSWFGFDHTVIQGMKEVFDVNITLTGYYFLFGFWGAIKSVANFLNPNRSTIKFNNDKAKK